MKEVRKVFRRLAIFASLLPAAISIARAGDTSLSRETLKGATAIGVVIEDLGPEVERYGLKKGLIQSAVEAKLRGEGVLLASPEQLSSASGIPYLHIELLVKSDNRLRWAFSIATEFNQSVQLSRDTGVTGRAITWSISGVGTVVKQNVRDIMGIIDQDVGKFIAAYRAVNPK